MNTHSKPPRLVALALAALLLMGAPACLAAKAPVSDAERKKQASHIVSGEVVSVPMAAGVESLNVTVAASLLLFAAGRVG